MKKDTYFFQGIGASSKLSKAFEDNLAFNEIQQSFNSHIEFAKSAETKQEKQRRLETLLHNNKFIENLTSNQLMNVFSAFRNLGDFSNMILLYEKAENQTFKQALMVQEFLMVAYNKTNQTDSTISLASQLIKQDKISGDVYGGLGKAYLMKSESASSLQEKQEFLKKSKDAYEEGFLRFAEFYPGINAVYRHIELNEFEKAKNLAELVYLACKKEGAEETNDYWCTTTQLESACIANKDENEILDSLNNLLKYDVANWQFESTLGSLKKINEILNLPIVENIINKLEEKIANNETLKLNENTENFENEKTKDLLTDAILKRSYNYRGLASNFEGASRVGGNFKFGGQLPDHSISRKDIEIFDGILNQNFENLFPKNFLPKKFLNLQSFNQTEDINKFLDLADEFIRFHYGTKNFVGTDLFLEDNAEINNSVYDQTVNAVISLSGKKGDKSADSRTNISTIFALGMGDCRHHAQVKQILFDRWQGKKMKKALISAHICLNNNDKDGYEKNISYFKSLLKVELRTVDVRVSLPIKVHEMYNAMKTQDGKFISTTKNENSVLEEHTMNILLNKNELGKIEKLSLSDSFYQNTYQWKNFEIDLEKSNLIDDEFSFFAGYIPKEKVDNNKDLPITISPAIYAGKRDLRSQDEHGNNLMLLNIPIKTNSVEDFLSVLQNRNAMEKNLNLIRNYNNQKEKALLNNQQNIYEN